MSDEQRFSVVVNGAEQYSVWPDGRTIPGGWRATGVRGTRGECLSHIDEVWTALRPSGLRARGGKAA